MATTQLSVRAAAKRLDLKYGQVIRMIRSGKLKAKKVEGGWGWLIDSKDVDAIKCPSNNQ